MSSRHYFQGRIAVLLLTVACCSHAIQAPIHVGTPPQAFVSPSRPHLPRDCLTSRVRAPPQNVILDTGSADFWLADTNCTTAECLLVRTFAANNSESSVPAATDFSIRYGQVRTPADTFKESLLLSALSLLSTGHGIGHALE